MAIWSRIEPVTPWGDLSLGKAVYSTVHGAGHITDVVVDSDGDVDEVSVVFVNDPSLVVPHNAWGYMVDSDGNLLPSIHPQLMLEFVQLEGNDAPARVVKMSGFQVVRDIRTINQTINRTACIKVEPTHLWYVKLWVRIGLMLGKLSLRMAGTRVRIVGPDECSVGASA